jgi:hypothetical protein
LNQLETCLIEEGNTKYSVFLYRGTSQIKYIVVRDKLDESYYEMYFKKNGTIIKKHNVYLNEILSLRKNKFGGYNYDIEYYLPSLNQTTHPFRICTDSLNLLISDYCYYEYDKKKSSYKYVSGALAENEIKNDSLVFKYFEVSNLNELNYFNYSNGSVGIKSKRNKKANLLIPKDLTFDQGSSSSLVGELHVYFKRNQQLDSINLLLVFQGDLQARLIDFNQGCNKLQKKFRSNDLTEKRKICKELKKFGINFKKGKAIMSESLMSALDI